ncbi:TPA: hypothetical protein R1907_000009 [Staphylococcus delphini]|uniref:hypothetical protein n=1 Tax=Staphylococcus delphini TaxID=53344 RepID=UPI0015C8C678|nr:hypothetical protein [Staphylococcus delphini]HEC2154363.1 hypothetical protein [Staphylococcus delphini]HEC2174709.1 hypothetical protein [Staphylococcus delphini]
MTHLYYNYQCSDESVYTFEDLEDIYDAKVGDEALKEYRETGQNALDIEDVMK